MNFDRLGAYLDSLSGVGVPACDMVIYQDHKPVYRHMNGFMDHERTKKVQGDETYNLYSCSKLFTTCAVMQLVEQEMIRLDDPVSRYLPAYAELTVRTPEGVVPAKRTMTIRHLMSMQSGLDYDLDTPAIRALKEQNEGRVSTREVADVLTGQPLQFEPGTDFLYSLSHDVLGAVIEVVSGLSFGEYLQKHIFDPLGLKTIGFGLKEKDSSRQCAQYEIQPESGEYMLLPKNSNVYKLGSSYESGGAGLVSDVQDCITFLDAIACGGTAKDGTRILSPEAIQIWNTNQLIGKSRRSFDEWERKGYSYGLGVRTRVDLGRGGAGAIGEFGWDGAAGAWAMIDSNLNISAFYAMHVKNFDYCYDVIHPCIRSLIYEGMNE